MALVRRYFALGLGVSVVLGLLFAFFGVYDTNELPFYQRFIFWTATMVTGTATAAFIGPAILNSRLAERGPAAIILTIAAIISLPITVVVALFDVGMAFTSPFTQWLRQYFFVLMISLIIVGGTYLALAARGVFADKTVQHDNDTNPARKFLERLPVRYRHGELFAISSEDHYLRVHTNVGEELILMRLSDAMRELGEDIGLQVHRSWWVAQDGVADVRTENGKRTLVLKSGAEAPVSRSFAKNVKDAGLA